MEFEDENNMALGQSCPVRGGSSRGITWLVIYCVAVKCAHDAECCYWICGGKRRRDRGTNAMGDVAL